MDTDNATIKPWVGVDLDGTLAFYDGWKGPAVIGDPIPMMVNRVHAWMSSGITVKILTARATPGIPGCEEAVAAVKAWSREVFGLELPVTHQKDYGMTELWDDRAVQVLKNQGVRADGTECLLDPPWEALKYAAGVILGTARRLTEEYQSEPVPDLQKKVNAGKLENMGMELQKFLKRLVLRQAMEIAARARG